MRIFKGKWTIDAKAIEKTYKYNTNLDIMFVDSTDQYGNRTKINAVNRYDNGSNKNSSENGHRRNR